MNTVAPPRRLRVRTLGRQPYGETLDAMRRFTTTRDAQSVDELWLLQHPPVFTLGQGGLPEHLLEPGIIPVVRSDRGGQVTYHGPGQLVVYTLLNLPALGMGVRTLVNTFEQGVIDWLGRYDVGAERSVGAPGVYVDGKKIASVGLRVKKGCTYHGLSLNVDMDLEPFSRINPCGYPGLAVTQCRDLDIAADVETAGQELCAELCRLLGLTAEWQVPAQEHA